VGVTTDRACGLLTEQLGQHWPHLAAQLVAVQRSAESKVAHAAELVSNGLAHNRREKGGVAVLEWQTERLCQ
jgi:hypothetical protein